MGEITFVEISEIVATQYGTVRTIIFFCSSKIIRNRWLELMGVHTRRERISSSQITRISSILSLAVEPRGSNVLLSDLFDTECSINLEDHNNRGDSTDQTNRDSDGKRISFSIQLTEYLSSFAPRSETKLPIDVAAVVSPMQT